MQAAMTLIASKSLATEPDGAIALTLQLRGREQVIPAVMILAAEAAELCLGRLCTH